MGQAADRSENVLIATYLDSLQLCFLAMDSR